jgi:hypothetical protein
MCVCVFFLNVKKKEAHPWQLLFDFADILNCPLSDSLFTLLCTHYELGPPGLCTMNRAQFEREMQCLHVFPF